MKHYSYGKKRKTPKYVKKILGICSISCGLILLAYFFFPIISYHLFLSSAFAGDNGIESPLPKRYVLQGNFSLGSLFSQGITNVTSDYTDARNWFPNVNAPAGKSQKVESYQISFPSQGIDHATVSAVDFDLSKHLVQYFTTSKNPTDKGTSVIFGHSTLPQLFNPKNYMAVFAHMHLTKEGDEIIIHLNGQDYKYKVFSITIMSPDDANIFSQAFDNSYLTIVTCTPPGTTWKRLVIRAGMVL